MILTPVRALLKNDIEIREEIMKNLPDRFDYGFEVVLLGGPLGDLQKLKKIIENLKGYVENDFFLAVHASIERSDFTKKHTDLTTHQGLKTFKKVLQLSKKINAKIVNVHTENFHTGKELLEKEISTEKRGELREKVKKNIIQAKNSVKYDGIITVENMSYPLMGDDKNFTSVESMPYDPLMNTANDILSLSDIPEIGICTDTCHYGICKRTFSDAYRQKLTKQQLKKHGVLGVVYEDIKIQPSLIKLANKLGSSLKYIHLSDYRGVWIPNKSHFEEGLVPGEGEYENEIRDFIKFAFKKKIPISLEVRDKNLKKLNETKRALKYISKVL